MTTATKSTLNFADYEYAIPVATQAALERYVDYGLMPGGFLEAVITNDLFSAVGRADLGNRAALNDIVMFVLNRMPMGAVGSKDKMENWCKAVQEKRKQES